MRSAAVLTVCLFVVPLDARGDILLVGEAKEHAFVTVTATETGRWMVLGPDVVLYEHAIGLVDGNPIGKLKLKQVPIIVLDDGQTAVFVGPVGSYAVLCWADGAERAQFLAVNIEGEDKPDPPPPPPPPPDDGPLVSISADSRQITEPRGTTSIRVKIAKPHTHAITVQLEWGGSAVQGKDYHRTCMSSLLIVKGETEGVCAIAVYDDKEPNGIRTIDVRVTGAINAQVDGEQKTSILIVDDDVGPPPPPPPPDPKKIYALIVRETGNLTQEVALIITSPVIRAYMADGGHVFRSVDPDERDVDGNVPKDLKKYLEAASDKTLPYLFIATDDDGVVFEGELPKTVSDVLAKLKTYGGE